MHLRVVLLILLVGSPSAAVTQPDSTPIPSSLGCEGGRPVGLGAVFACECVEPGVCNIGAYCSLDPSVPCDSGQHGDCETTLSHVINDNPCVPSQVSGLDPWADAAVVPTTFHPTCNVSFKLVTRGATTFENAFGWYNATEGSVAASDLHVVFGGDAAAGTQTAVNLCSDPNYLGGDIGFFLITPEAHAAHGSCANSSCYASVERLAAGDGYAYYSEPVHNADYAGADSYIHLLSYDSRLDEARMYFAWADRYGGGSTSFTDLVVSAQFAPDGEGGEGGAGGADGEGGNDALGGTTPDSGGVGGVDAAGTGALAGEAGIAGKNAEAGGAGIGAAGANSTSSDAGVAEAGNTSVRGGAGGDTATGNAGGLNGAGFAGAAGDTGTAPGATGGKAAGIGGTSSGGRSAGTGGTPGHSDTDTGGTVASGGGEEAGTRANGSVGASGASGTTDLGSGGTRPGSGTGTSGSGLPVDSAGETGHVEPDSHSSLGGSATREPAPSAGLAGADAASEPLSAGEGGQAALARGAEKGGCSCQVTGTRSGASLGWALLALTLRRNRRMRPARGTCANSVRPAPAASS